MEGYLSVAEAAERFGLSRRRVQLLCEQGRIENAYKLSGVWLIPANVEKPQDGRVRKNINGEQLRLFDIDDDGTDGCAADVNGELLTLYEVCELLSISTATGRNWVRLKKIRPAATQGRNLLFSRSDIDEILKAVSNGESEALNRRRNKKKMNKVSLYESYVSDNGNIGVINEIVSDFGTSINGATIRAILANFALQLICQKQRRSLSSNNLVKSFVDGTLDVSGFSKLIDDLLGCRNELVDNVDLDSPVFEHKVDYVEDDDTLGFAYISLMNLGRRKSKGTYYTPVEVVKKLVFHLKDTSVITGKYVLDPCCGSGNFLLEIGKHTGTPELLYGQDIDPIAIHITRISFALKFDILDLNFLYSHFTCADTFRSLPVDSPDIIIGNPPWGGDIPEDQLEDLSSRFETARKRTMDTFSLFTEYALKLLPPNGILAFVLPESILTVKAHSIIRSVVLRECNFKFAHYLGEAFKGVQCPSIILGVEKSEAKVPGVPKVYHNGECYSLQSNRQISVERFNFRVTDEIQDCLDMLSNNIDFTYLLNQAEFALGIVTGNNSSYVSNARLPGYEPVLKGSDISKYRFAFNGNYIKFEPQNFQQVAPTELYRATEKLLYRFISDTLVFAYDDQQTLSLNSCNILIPKIPGLKVKYVLAILNSRVASFFFTHMYGSVKVLRSHLEHIPIPVASEKEQEEVVRMVNLLLSNEANVGGLYDELDKYIMSLYKLGSRERDIVERSMVGKKLFLP